jgi:hypothetical protein
MQQVELAFKFHIYKKRSKAKPPPFPLSSINKLDRKFWEKTKFRQIEAKFRIHPSCKATKTYLF